MHKWEHCCPDWLRHKMGPISKITYAKSAQVVKYLTSKCETLRSTSQYCQKKVRFVFTAISNPHNPQQVFLMGIATDFSPPSILTILNLVVRSYHLYLNL
jgi:hypothetical protein